MKIGTVDGPSWAPSKTFAFTAQAYVGKDPVLDAPRTLVDAVANRTIGESAADVFADSQTGFALQEVFKF